MPIADFPDVTQKRKTRRDGIARQRWLLLPITIFWQIRFAIARLVGSEFELFSRFFKPMGAALHKGIERAFKDYEPTPQDVFVCAFMKSGTNWMMQVVHQIANRGEGEFNDIFDVVPWPDCPSRDMTIGLTDPRPAQLAVTGMRAIKTHAPTQNVPYNNAAKYICVTRDPKDVVVSAYHFFSNVMLGPLMPTVPTWARNARRAILEPWVEFTNGYWLWRDRPNVLFLTYEQMLDDPRDMIRKIATLMEVALTEPEVEKVYSLSSFAYMKSVDHKFYPGEMTPFARPGGRMVRQGKKGTSGELLSVEEQHTIDAYCRQRLQELGSDFPYDPYYGGDKSESAAQAETGQ